jgi:RNA polymerase sigma-54 factor
LKIGNAELISYFFIQNRFIPSITKVFYSIFRYDAIECNFESLGELMAIKMNQALKQTQGLTMTPQLQQAIKILTLTHLEMTDVISKEMVENPVLEIQDSEKSKEEIREQKKGEELTAENFSSESEMKKSDEFDWEKYANSHTTSSSSPVTSERASKDDLPDYENMVSQEVSLQDHLEWQIRMESFMGEELKLALIIIHSLDDDGFIDQDLEKILAEFKIEIDLEVARDVLEHVQRLDPVGCATKNTKEALIVQAKMIPGRAPLVETLIESHLESLYKKKYDHISKLIEVSVESIKVAESLILTLHPRPGQLIAKETTHYVTPDIYVKKIGGELVVQLNNEGVPRLKVSKLYQSLLKNQSDDQTKDYIQDKMRAALWLIKSIENRQKTIEKVSKAIVAYQPEFFLKGPEHLKPMILKDIAAEVEMHESTISRVTTNKFMHTPLGTFELKYFFNNAVGGKDGGTDIASESLKLKIKGLIEREDARRPLSDQKIVTLLAQSEIKVARRTVAKYRESLGIMSSAKRKK